jgi:hypothetical protein
VLEYIHYRLFFFFRVASFVWHYPNPLRLITSFVQLLQGIRQRVENYRFVISNCVHREVL